MVVGNKDYSLDINQAVTNFQPVNVSGNVVNKDSRYSEKTFAKDYDTRNNLLTLRTEGENDFGYIWGYDNTLTIAKIANKLSDYLPGFTSFEKEAKGNWSYNDNGVVTSDALTGKQSFNLAYGGNGPALYVATPSNPGAPHQIIAGRYIVSYWKKNGTVTVNGSNPSLTGATANGWTYCEHTFVDPYNIMQINGTALIDELRFYTEGSLMESYTYNPLIGITSVNNATNHITLYEYDAMGRLTIERDVFGKIIKQHTYKYQVTE
jgi:YD repeat-containing protein